MSVSNQGMVLGTVNTANAVGKTSLKSTFPYGPALGQHAKLIDRVNGYKYSKEKDSLGQPTPRTRHCASLWR
jgi:hypothetical protein